MIHANIRSGPAKVVTTGSVHSFIETVSADGKVRAPGLVPQLISQALKAESASLPKAAPQPVDIDIFEGSTFLFRLRFKITRTEDKKPALKTYPEDQNTLVVEFVNLGDEPGDRDFGSVTPHQIGSDNSGRDFYISWNAHVWKYGFLVHYTVFVTEGGSYANLQD